MTFEQLIELLTSKDHFEKLAEYADQHRQCCA